jgi:hypothetical protein
MTRTFLRCSLQQRQPSLGSRRFDDPCDAFLLRACSQARCALGGLRTQKCVRACAAFPQLLRVTIETADPMTTSQVVAPRFPAPLGVVRTRSPACETFRWMKTQIPPYRANHTSFGLKSAGNPLTYNGRDHARFEVKPLILAIKNVTLNQRVQGSSPCAPTSNFSIQLQGLRLPPQKSGQTANQALSNGVINVAWAFSLRGIIQRWP